MADPNPPPPPAAPLTVDDLITKVRALDASRSALGAAHADTTSAQQALTDTTVKLQADIDAATAAYDGGTTTAKQAVSDKQAAESQAAAAEQAVFDDLESALQSFKAGS